MRAAAHLRAGGPAAPRAYEKFEVDDFAREVLQPWMGAVDTGAGESYFLGYRVPGCDVNILRVLLNYRF